jgi:hypothetical protein
MDSGIVGKETGFNSELCVGPEISFVNILFRFF